MKIEDQLREMNLEALATMLAYDPDSAIKMYVRLAEIRAEEWDRLHPPNRKVSELLVLMDLVRGAGIRCTPVVGAERRGSGVRCQDCWRWKGTRCNEL